MGQRAKLVFPFTSSKFKQGKLSMTVFPLSLIVLRT